MKARKTTLTEHIEGLQTCSLFHGLSKDDLEALADVARMRTYETGEVLFHANAPAEGFHVIVSGEVKVCRYGADGREQVLHLFGSGEPCGEVPVFEGGVYPGTVEALEPVVSLYLPRDGFIAVSREHPDLLFGMLALLSRRLRGFVNLIDDLSLKEVSTRVARHILQLSEAEGSAESVELGSTKTMLASRLGTIAETLSRTLSRMQKSGIITVSGKCITIKDPAALTDLADGVRL